MLFLRSSWWTRERWSCAGSLLLLLLVWVLTDLSGWVERGLYDHATDRAGKPASADVLVVAIDGPSLTAHGAWPWPREQHARLIDRLHASGARVVAVAEAFVGPESPRALEELHRIARTVASDPDLARHPQLPMVLSESRELLDGDARLAHSLSSQGRSLLLTGAAVAEAAPIEALLARAPTSAGAQPASGRASAAADLTWPPLALASAARALGHMDLSPDSDGLLRHHPVWSGVGGTPVLSLAVQAAALQLGVDPAVLAQQAGSARALRIGERTVPLDGQGRLVPLFSRARGSQPALSQLSAQAVLSGRFKPAAVHGKLVWVGRTGTLAAVPLMQWDTPVQRALAPVEVAAQLSSALLTGQVVAAPSWARWLPWMLLVPVVFHLLGWGSRLAPAAAWLVGLLLALSLLLLGELTLQLAHLWVPLGLPAMALVVGTAGLMLSRHGPEWRTRGQALQAAWGLRPAESNRPVSQLLAGVRAPPAAAPTLLGGAQVPGAVSAQPSVLPSVFEGQGGFSVAAAAWPQPERESAQGTPAAQGGSATEQPAGSVGVTADATLPLQHSPVLAGAATAVQEADPVRPNRLGAFLLQSELGRGTMGRVYLASEMGQASEVAIKTLALAREFEGFALREARSRFQREAAAARRLQHPDIVRVLDVGEHNGLAYLVMERVRGVDLTHHIRRHHLLSMRSVVALGARVASALAHAHSQGVIHRDIKPANIMVDLAGGQVKVMDFGIAHLSDAARTRTGLVLGSPSYMSPEQLQGRPADGRSDLYSLGVVLFQLLTAELPFKGSTLADLIHAVVHTPAPDVRSLVPEVPESLATLLSILLQKRPELRYPDGRQLAADLRLVGAALSAARRRTGSQEGSRQESAPSTAEVRRRG